MNGEPTLKPCPFCGGPAEVAELKKSKDHPTACFAVRCQRRCGVCPFTGWLFDRAAAVRLWQTRTEAKT